MLFTRFKHLAELIHLSSTIYQTFPHDTNYSKLDIEPDI